MQPDFGSKLSTLKNLVPQFGAPCEKKKKKKG
jgi:hypothetical protein